MNLIQLLTDQRAYEWITQSRWGASWNWRWRMVGDDEERRPPSPKPQTDSRSGLPMKNRRGGGSILWNAIILSPWFFSGIMWIYSIRGVVSGATRWVQPTWARQERGRALVGCAQPGAPLRWVLAPKILIIDIKKSSQSFVPFRELLFLHKNNTMVVLLKTASVRG